MNSAAPSKSGQNTLPLTTRLPEDLVRKFDRYARRRGVSRSQAMRELIVKALDRDDRRPPGGI